MSTLLTLAADFFEKMQNPEYGSVTNDEYSHRFALLIRGERNIERISTEIVQLRRENELTAGGWLWVLKWAKARRLKLNKELLISLAKSYASVPMLFPIVSYSTAFSEWEPHTDIYSIQDSRFGIIGDIMSFGVREPIDGEEIENIDVHYSESLLLALLQVEHPMTLDAARSLLNHDWAGMFKLRETYFSFCDDLDEESRENWFESVFRDGDNSNLR